MEGTDPISVDQYLANILLDVGQAPSPYSDFGISDIAGHIQELTPDQIAAMYSHGVYSITSTDASLQFTAAQIEAIEASPVLITVPQGDTISVVDTAADLEAMSVSQLQGLAQFGVTSIAGSDAPPVFNAAQMNALGTGGTDYEGHKINGVAVVAPPNDPDQNDGTTVITGANGGGLTFDVTWDASVASAPANFETDVEEAFQFYANEFSNPITLYYTVGFGEAGGNALGSGELGYNYVSYEDGNPTETYGTLLQALKADATSAAQQIAVASLPASDPTGGAALDIPTAEMKALGLNDPEYAPTSPTDPDDKLGISDTFDFDYSPNPNDTAGLVADSNAYDVLGTILHEMSEGMGRASFLNDGGSGGTTTSYSPMDLFRYSAPGTRALDVLQQSVSFLD